jgi:hypothetical protein
MIKEVRTIFPRDKKPMDFGSTLKTLLHLWRVLEKDEEMRVRKSGVGNDIYFSLLDLKLNSGVVLNSSALQFSKDPIYHLQEALLDGSLPVRDTPAIGRMIEVNLTSATRYAVRLRAVDLTRKKLFGRKKSFNKQQLSWFTGTERAHSCGEGEREFFLETILCLNKHDILPQDLVDFTQLNKKLVQETQSARYLSVERVANYRK